MPSLLSDSKGQLPSTVYKVLTSSFVRNKTQKIKKERERERVQRSQVESDIGREEEGGLGDVYIK